MSDSVTVGAFRYTMSGAQQEAFQSQLRVLLFEDEPGSASLHADAVKRRDEFLTAMPAHVREGLVEACEALAARARALL